MIHATDLEGKKRRVPTRSAAQIPASSPPVPALTIEQDKELHILLFYSDETETSEMETKNKIITKSVQSCKQLVLCHLMQIKHLMQALTVANPILSLEYHFKVEHPEAIRPSNSLTC